MNTSRHVRAAALTLATATILAGCAATSSTTSSSSRAPSSSTPASQTHSATTSTTTGPSQSAADAKRDGVVAQLAAIPFAARVGIQTSVVTPEGVWAISRPTKAAQKYATGCRLGPETGKYPTTTICTTEYGEVLLLDSTRTRILRSYPLAAVPPKFLVVTPDAVWCGREGDTVLSETTLPDSLVCRIDRRTYEARMHVFAPGEESEVMQPCFFPPKCWTVTRGRLQMTALEVDAHSVWAKDHNGTWTRIDPATLAVTATRVHR